MKKIRAEDMKDLPFGTKVVVTYPNNKDNKPNSYTGVKVANMIAYENGVEDDICILEEQLTNNICYVFIL